MRLCLNSIIHEVLFIGELLLSLRVLLLSSSRAGAFLQAIRCFPEREIITRGLTDAEQQRRIRELERENAELRRANDILKDALGFFAKDRKK